MLILPFVSLLPNCSASQTLTHLYLSINQVSSETAILLGQALVLKNCALELLDLSWNMIKSEGVKVRGWTMSIVSLLALYFCGVLRRASC